MITEGETSDVFYFYTLPTLPPADLACETTYDSLSLTWSQPTLGMEENTTYYYSYNLIKSMYAHMLFSTTKFLEEKELFL